MKVPSTTMPKQRSAPSVNTRSIPVLITARELDQGGVERDVSKIALHLDRRRFEPHVAAFYARGLRYEELRSAGIPVLDLPLRSLMSVDAFRLAWTMQRYLKQHCIQVVHAYDASGVFVLPVAKLAGVPVTIGSQLSYRNILDRRTQKLLRISDRFPDVVLVNCEAIRRYMVRDEQVAAERIELCYNGVDTSQFYPPPSRPTTPRMVGTVCALRHEKNLPLLQEAFARVRHSHSDLKLVFVGSGAELRDLKINAARLGILEESLFVPATSDVASWLRKMDIFVLPSYSEAFSNSLLEAMACGCAVIGSHVGGTPELTGDHEERGLLFTSGDSLELTAKLARLLGDHALRQMLGSRAAQFARENLSIQIAAERTAALYERLLTRKMTKCATTRGPVHNT